LRALLVLLFLLGRVALAADAPAPAAEPGIYIVQEGDTCLDIAKKVWPADPDGLDKLHLINQMGPLPHKLVAGMRLRTTSNTADAKITFLKPDVNIKKAGRPDWLTGKIGEELFNLDQITTLAGAAAEVLFRDKSALQIDQNALVTVYGIIHGGRGPSRSGQIELVQGDLRLHLASLRGESATMAVKVPGGEVASKASELHVGVDDKKMSRVSVFEGSAAVAAYGQKVEVRRGFGTRVPDGSPPEVPQALPAAPSWTSGGTADVIIALTKDGAPATIRWSDVTSAAHYRVELSGDEKFNGKLKEREVKPGGPLQLDLGKLALGRYYARVSAYNAAGLVGPASVTKRIDVAALIFEAGTLGSKPNTLVGSVEIRVRLPEGSSVSGVVDGTQQGSPVVVRGVGKHTLKLMSANGSVLNSFDCVVEPPKVVIEFTPGLKEVVVRFYDRNGKPASFTQARELGLLGLSGTRVGQLKAVGTGHEWRAEVLPVRTGSGDNSALVRVLWNGETIKEGMKDEPSR
jgi:hypothetical protein